MVVDDSVVIRRLVTQALEQDPVLQVVGTASNGTIGLQRIPLLNPDVITLDIEMPEMNGLEMLRCIRRDYPLIRVIMFSTLTERGAMITFEALASGADDYITKSTNETSIAGSISRLQAEIIPKIKQFFRFPGESGSPNRVVPALDSSKPSARQPMWKSPAVKVAPKVVVIGVSTGGPTALGAILPQLPATFPLPILIVQHMPPLFTRLLAERLNSACQLQVAEAIHGSLVEPGRILVAPGDFHMKVVAGGGRACISLDQSPLQSFCRPAVDALFASSAEVFGGAVLAVVLTGMGQDGLRGTGLLRAQGANVLAQDETSSVVWGMPGAVVNAGLADRVLPLGDVVPEILRLAGRI
jgi:two-component system chemotaxis response regulator CheB